METRVAPLNRCGIRLTTLKRSDMQCRFRATTAILPPKRFHQRRKIEGLDSAADDTSNLINVKSRTSRFIVGSLVDTLPWTEPAATEYRANILKCWGEFQGSKFSHGLRFRRAIEMAFPGRNSSMPGCSRPP
jgi:hypothetical protein